MWHWSQSPNLKWNSHVTRLTQDHAGLSYVVLTLSSVKNTSVRNHCGSVNLRHHFAGKPQLTSTRGKKCWTQSLHRGVVVEGIRFQRILINNSYKN